MQLNLSTVLMYSCFCVLSFLSWVAKDAHRPPQHIGHHSQRGGHPREPHVRGPRWGLCGGVGDPGRPHSPVHQGRGSHTRPQTRATQREGANRRPGGQVRSNTHTQDTLPLLKYNINVDGLLPCSLLPALERVFLQLVIPVTTCFDSSASAAHNESNWSSDVGEIRVNISQNLTNQHVGLANSLFFLMTQHHWEASYLNSSESNVISLLCVACALIRRHKWLDNKLYELFKALKVYSCAISCYHADGFRLTV